jgi:hypothetical protein
MTIHNPGIMENTLETATNVCSDKEVNHARRWHWFCAQEWSVLSVEGWVSEYETAN